MTGRFRQPDSVRGKKEGRAQMLEATGTKITRPSYLSEEVGEVWDDLVTKLTDAKVPLREVDANAVEMAARCLVDLKKLDGIETDNAKDRIAAMNLSNKLRKELMAHLEKISATPQARMRMGLKPTPEKKTGLIAGLLSEGGGA